MKEYIKGNYRKTIYSNESGYTIGLFKVRETDIEEAREYLNKTITFTGYFHELNLDDIYCFYGELVDNPKYKEITKRYDEKERLLKNSIGKDEFRIFEDFVDIYSELISFEAEENFVKGFSLFGLFSKIKVLGIVVGKLLKAKLEE